MIALPATNETWLIDYEPQVSPLPLIGWVHTTGLNVSPLVLGHPGPLVTGEAFLLHTGQVYDPSTGLMHEDEGSWRDTLSEDTLFRPGKPLPAFTIPTEAKAATAGPAATPAVLPARTPPQPKDPAPAGQIEWGTKTYKSKSFWAFTPPDEEEFIFVVEAENPVPKNATKITRDDFYAKRKAGAVERSGKPGDEPELPFVAPADEDDDDDLV
jgi:hypothetical protein